MRSKAKTTKRTILACLAATALALSAGVASAAAAPVWKIESLANTSAQPGGQIEYSIQTTNRGPEEITSAVPSTLNIELPPGLSAVSLSNSFGGFGAGDCPGGVAGQTSISCARSFAFGIGPRQSVLTILIAKVSPSASGVLTAHFEVAGGGATSGASAADPTLIQGSPPDFGIDAFDTQTTGDPSGAPFTQAAGHPYAVSTYIDFNRQNLKGGEIFGIPFDYTAYPIEPTKDVILDLPPGLIGNPSALTQCTAEQLSHVDFGTVAMPNCPPGSQVGTVRVPIAGIPAVGSQPAHVERGSLPLYNLVPTPGTPASFGFNILGTVITINTRLRSEGDYGLSAITPKLPVALAASGAYVDLWGTPGAVAHDGERGCSGQKGPFDGGPTCTSGTAGAPFLRLPTGCTGKGMPWGLHIDSWEDPAAFNPNGAPDLSDPKWKSAQSPSHKAPLYPAAPSEWGEEQGTEGCDVVPVKGTLTAKPTALETETSSGLDVHVDVPNPGLGNPDGIASSDIKDVTVKLPQGLTINPSQATGLGVCSPAQYESSELSFHPDGQHGCPTDSKIGTVSVHTPLLEETIPGNVYVAKPYDNPFNSLLALYIVLEEPQRGILVKLAGEIRLNETTGRIETEFKDLPQTPFSSFDFHFREGARAPLVTPPTCGTYTTETEIEGYSKPGDPISSNSTFQITKGIGGGPCPPGGTPGFKPLFSAGSVNNSAGAFSPFNLRIQRNDGEQDMTKFSSVLPPGVLGKLAGVSKCPDSALAIAKAKSGLQEIASPSCPASSEIGHSTVGAGVGSVLTYVPGKIYLGGAFHGDPLSVIAITPAVAGPFDVGTVVVHLALTLNPVTAEVEVDGSASDPIPHILKGIPAKLRDLRVYVDRDNFTLNPTSCDPSSAKATLFGSAANVFDPADDIPVALSDRYQAASCSSLGFKPNLALNLKGGTKRGGHPGLTATYTPRSGDANVKGLVVRLPRSAFLDQAHIKTICTRVQFAAKACPPGAQYGYIKAWTPLLEEPLEGPVYLRSSNHKLPDLVFDLHGLVDVEVATRIDSQKGGIRATVQSAPDAPLSKVLLRMQGAKKGLIVNSRNLCGAPSKANVEFTGQNGKEANANPLMKADCGGKRGRKQAKL